LEFSDFASWAEVGQWALPLYEVEKTNMPVELREMIVKWRDGSLTDEERARKALDFVQDGLRYTGLELGPDSYRPAHPFETFQLRYGDCKAKSVLLCTILSEMNIQARPALVDSGGGNIGEHLPSPFAFDHVIVKVILNGKTVWVDPTESNQGGLLWNRHVSHFGKALVIKPGVSGLEDIPFPAPDNAREEVTSTFKMEGYKHPVTLTIKTVYQGADADNNRDYFARNNRKEIQKNYLNYYTHYYPGIAEDAPMEVEDTRPANLMIITEHYRIGSLWRTNASEKRLEADIYGESLYHRLTEPSVRVRKMPLRVLYPMKQQQDVVVHLPDNDWELPAVTNVVTDDAFSFRAERTFADATIRYHYECETKSNAVPAARVAEYLKNRREMTDFLDEGLQRPFKVQLASGVNWLMVVIAIFGFGATVGGCAGIWYLTRFRAVAAEGAVPPMWLENQHLQGIGGWLILVGIGLCLTPFTRVFAVGSNWQAYFSLRTWELVAVPSGAAYHPFYAPLLILELLGNIALFGLNVLAIFMYFGRQKAFPKVYISLLIINVVFLAFDEVMSSRIASPGGSVASPQIVTRAILMTCIWSGYMCMSRRVKATFVR
jgi:hypothetical protein